MASAGWYPDQSQPGRQRYFDGTRWTDNYYHGTAGTPPMCAAPPADLSRAATQPPAGWYPDSDAPLARRRYWDGLQWTNHYADAEIKTPNIGWKVYLTLAAVFVMLVASAVAGSEKSSRPDSSPGDGDLSGPSGVLVAALLCAPIAWGIYLAFRYDKRRKQRQQLKDRNAGLGINAEIEDAAYNRGDDQRGIYGQFPPKQ